MRVQVILYCTICNRQNYFTTKNKKLNKGKLEQKKYCSQCQKVTVQIEKKKK